MLLRLDATHESAKLKTPQAPDRGLFLFYLACAVFFIRAGSFTRPMMSTESLRAFFSWSWEAVASQLDSLVSSVAIVCGRREMRPPDLPLESFLTLQMSSTPSL